jgi:hypothetical protein
MTMMMALALCALILAGIEQINARMRSLLAWAVLVLAAGHFVR